MKDSVIRLLFDFFSQYMSPKEAVVATLGGWGLEATFWNELGVKSENGWLIERSRTGRTHLIRNFHYRHVNQLKSFPVLFKAVNGEDTGVDFFHLDLCGTIEPSYELIEGLVPLVLASKGRCLAITVADQRRNRSDEHFKPVFIEGKKMFGKNAAEALLRSLKSEGNELASHFDDRISGESVARREYGFLVHLAKVLGDTKIEQMVRYVYHSEIGGNNMPFRMRTYMFRLSKGELVPSDWVRSPVRMVTPDGLVVINPKHPQEEGVNERKQGMKFDPEKFPALAGMLKHTSAEVRADFKRLLASFVEPVVAVDTLVRDIEGVLAKYSIDGKQVEKSLRAKREPKKRDQKSEDFPGKRFGTTSDNVAVKIHLLEAEAQGEDSLEKARERCYEFLGITNLKNKRGTVGAHHARTKGDTFRPSFVKSILASTPQDKHDEVLGLLASSYTTLGHQTDMDTLRQEAVSAGYVQE
jgi:hypothetical protein